MCLQPWRREHTLPHPPPSGTPMCAHLHNLIHSFCSGTLSQCLPLSDVNLSQIAPSYLCLNMLMAPNFWKKLKENMKTFVQQAPTFLLSVASKLLQRITQKHLSPTLPTAAGPHLCSPPGPSAVPTAAHLPPPSGAKDTCSFRDHPSAAFLPPFATVPLESWPQSPRAQAAAPMDTVLFSRPRVWGGHRPQPRLISCGFGGSQLSCFAVFLSEYLPWWLRGKASACNAGDPGFIPGSGRFPGEGKGHPLQFSCLENSMGYNPRGCKESDRLSNFTFTFFSEYPFTGSWLEHPSSSLQVGTSFCPSDLPPQPSFCRM